MKKIAFVIIICILFFLIPQNLTFSQADESCTDSLTFGLSIPENIANFPISHAIPFPQGTITSLNNLELKNENGIRVPTQFDSLVKWPDGSEKSVLLTFLTDGNSDSYTLNYGNCFEQQIHSSDLSIDETSSNITITNNKIRAKISKNSFTIFDKLYIDENENGYFETTENLLSSSGDLILKDHLGADQATFRSSLDTSNYNVSVVTNGSERVVIKATGKLKSNTGETAFGDDWLTSFEIYFTFYAHTEFINIFYTLIDDNEHEDSDGDFDWPSGCRRNDGRTKCQSAFEIEELKFQLPLTANNYSYTAGGENSVHTGTVTNEHYLYQFSVPPLIPPPLPPPKETPPPRTEYSDKDGGFVYDFTYSGVGNGSKAPGWFDVSDNNKGISVGIKNFWQEYPFEISIHNNNFEIKFQPTMREEAIGISENEDYPPQPEEFVEIFYSYYPGFAKSFETFLYPHTGNYQTADIAKINANFQNKPVFSIDTEWYSNTGIFGPLSNTEETAAENSYYTAYQTKMNNSLDFQQRDGSHATRTYYRVYGKRDYGDYHLGGGPSYGNSHYEDAKGQILQFLITGNREWYDLAEAFARHHMDIDVRHVGGDDYFYANQPPGMIIGHSYEHEVNSHTEVGHYIPGGLTENYLLVGNPRMLDVIREQGNFVSGMVQQEGSKNRTDISKGKTFEYERGHAWLLYTLLKTFEATNDEQYLNTAAILMDDIMEWWKESQDHQECTLESNDNLAFYEKSDWEQGTGYFIPTRRMANDSHTSNDLCGRIASPWMGALLLSSIIEWYDLIENHYDGVYSVHDVTETSDPSITITNDITDTDGTINPDVKEMISQTVDHLAKYGWIDQKYYELYPSAGYPWMRKLTSGDDYSRPMLVYSACPIRVDRYPTTHDGEQYFSYVLEYASNLPGIDNDKITKWRYIADRIYEIEITDDPDPKWGYHGAPWLWSSPNFIALKKCRDEGICAISAEPADPEPGTEPEPEEEPEPEAEPEPEPGPEPEEEPEPSMEYLNPDVNGDWVVNILDLAQIALNFGKSSYPIQADINQDNQINTLDLELVAKDFSIRVTPPRRLRPLP